jgi:predicted metal-dependent phosphoesterase TrpH
MALKMDLHIHTTYSDGTMRPVDIVKMYQPLEYGVIAITDHDGIDGVKEAQVAGEALNLQVITGIELGTVFNDETELHILGYYIDIDNEPLKARLKEIRKARDVRNEKLLRVFQDMGYDISEEDLLQRPGQTYIGKPNFALAFAKKGYVDKPVDAFGNVKFLDAPEARAVKKEKVTSEEAISLIKGAGGIACLAHPMKIKGIGEKGSEEFFENLDKIVRPLKKAGLGAIECFHPSADHEEALRLVGFAEKYHLHITEGSDFHGPEFEGKK